MHIQVVPRQINFSHEFPRESKKKSKVKWKVYICTILSFMSTLQFIMVLLSSHHPGFPHLHISSKRRKSCLLLFMTTFFLSIVRWCLMLMSAVREKNSNVIQRANTWRMEVHTGNNFPCALLSFLYSNTTLPLLLLLPVLQGLYTK